VGLIDDVKAGFQQVFGSDETPAATAPPPPPPAPEAPPPEAPASPATPDSSANAAAAHAASLTPAQLQLADKLKSELYSPIPVGADGRYEYEAAMDGLSQDDVFKGPPPAGLQYEDCRCDCESTVGAMLSRGKAGFGESVDDLGKFAASQKPQTAEMKDLATECTEMKRMIAEDKVAPYDLAKLSDKMYAAFADKDSKGKPVHAGLDDNATMKMQNACGLAPSESQVTAPWNGDPMTLPKAQNDATAKLFAGLNPGDTCSIGVSEGTKGAGMMDHYVCVGKKPDGTPFCFDSGGPNPPGPNYFEGDAALQHVAPMALGSKNNSAFGFLAFKHGHGSAD
jgi:hypothetical protein